MFRPFIKKGLNSMSFKHNDVSKLAMANTWDKVLEYNRDVSLYYAIMVQKIGQELADYYWDRRYSFEKERDDYYIQLCKEITEKSTKFLKSRGIRLR